MINLQDINVIFETEDQEIHAVRDVNLKVEEGDIYGIVGYSGAGKSTLVRVINLLQKPSTGSVEVNGEDLLGMKPQDLRNARKKIGMIFQHFNLMNQRTVYGNVEYALRSSDLPEKGKDARIRELLTLVGLENRATAYPSELSGGQKQRVGIARALANDPKILLCDEATSALDPKTTEQILELLTKLNEELGITIVIITHEMDVIKQICNKVAVMEHGEVVEQGGVVDIFTRPQNPLTQEFINTASKIDQSLQNLAHQQSVYNLTTEDDLVLLSFVGEVTGTPLISTLNLQFKVSANILYANVDILNDTPVGNLALVVSGPDANREAAFKYLSDQGVSVQFLDIVSIDGQRKVVPVEHRVEK